MESRGHGLAEDETSARTALRQAEREYSLHHRGEEPTWLGFYSQAELDADLGRCLRDVGDTAPAALTAAAPLRSMWTSERLSDFHRAIRPVRQRSASLRELDDELTEFLTHAVTASQEDLS